MDTKLCASINCTLTDNRKKGKDKLMTKPPIFCIDENLEKKDIILNGMLWINLID